MEKSDINIDGVGTINQGEYKDINIDGMGKIQGDVIAERVEINGKGKELEKLKLDLDVILIGLNIQEL